MNQKTKISNQFIQDTIPKPKNNNCSRCELLEVENQRLEWLIANMMQSVDNIEELSDEK